MDTQGTTIPYIKSEGDRDILEDERICTLCMRLVSCEFTTDEDFSSTKGLLMCKVCVDSMNTQTNFANNVLNVKKEIDDIYGDIAIEGLSGIKCEQIEIKSEENYNDTPSNDIKDEPADCKSNSQSEYIRTTNDSTLKRKRKQHGPKDKYHNLKRRDFLEAKIYKCDSCGYETHLKSNLTRHRLKHEDVPEQRMHRCDSCSYKTKRRDSLARHQLKHKDIPEEQMFRCYLCSYETYNKRCLSQHVLKHLSNKQMYKCDECNFKTIRKISLTRHQLSHTDIPEAQMYKCDLCDYKTNRRKYLKPHQLRHINITEEQMFKCGFCDYKTRQKRLLVSHQLRHKDIPGDQTLKAVVV